MENRVVWRRMLVGIGMGAALAFYLDAKTGKRRRARVRDRLHHWFRLGREQAGKSLWDALERSRGLKHSIAAAFQRRIPDGHVLEQRVRTKMGRYVSHPHAIQTQVLDGEVTLSGPILARELERLLHAVSKVPGVRLVHNHLETHAHEDHIPGLQGGIPRAGRRPEFMQEVWSPAIRSTAGVIGAGLVVVGLRRRDLRGSFAAAAGSALVLRTLFNRRMRRIIGLGAGREAVDLEKTLSFQAPVEKVFGLWTDFQNLPRYLSHLEEVRDLGGGVYHWKAKVMGGLSLHWDTETTDFEPNSRIEWKSLPGSKFRNTGFIRFIPSEEGGTRVDVRLSYTPPGGALADAFARLLGVDAKSRLDQDLMVMKNTLERELAGTAPS